MHEPAQKWGKFEENQRPDMPINTEATIPYTLIYATPNPFLFINICINQLKNSQDTKRTYMPKNTKSTIPAHCN